MSLDLLNIPASNATVGVSIIDTTFRATGVPRGDFFGPDTTGMDTYDAVAYSFLIENGDDRRVLFDLGPPKNFRNDLPPAVVASVEAWEDEGTTVNIDKYVNEILTDEGVDLESIEAMIWSHMHWDHIGRPSLFPASTELIMGYGVGEAVGPGYPENQAAGFFSSELEGRTVTEMEFDDDAPRIGGLQAHDYFGDGSFYILDAPGHEIGHLNGLARVTTNPDSFILLGADSFHHPSSLRPNEGVQLPEAIHLEFHPENFPDPILAQKHLYPLHPASKDPADLPSWAANLTDLYTTPFTTVSSESDFSVDPSIARDVISKLQAFDADERVLVLAAHDQSMLNILDFFPEKANDWQEKNFKERGRWQFLEDFEKGLVGASPCAIGHAHSH